MRDRGSGKVVELRPAALDEPESLPVRLDPDPSPETVAANRELFGRQKRLCTSALIAANTLGGAIVFALAVSVVPGPRLASQPAVDRLNLITFAILGPIGLIAGTVLSIRLARRRSRWLLEGRTPTPAERTGTLRYALDQAGIEAGLWGTAAVIFSVINSRYS